MQWKHTEFREWFISQWLKGSIEHLTSLVEQLKVSTQTQEKGDFIYWSVRSLVLMRVYWFAQTTWSENRRLDHHLHQEPAAPPAGLRFDHQTSDVLHFRDPTCCGRVTWPTCLELTGQHSEQGSQNTCPGSGTMMSSSVTDCPPSCLSLWSLSLHFWNLLMPWIYSVTRYELRFRLRYQQRHNVEIFDLRLLCFCVKEAYYGMSDSWHTCWVRYRLFWKPCPAETMSSHQKLVSLFTDAAGSLSGG